MINCDIYGGIYGDEWQQKLPPHQFMNSSSYDSPMDSQKAADLGLWIHPLSARRFSRISRGISAQPGDQQPNGDGLDRVYDIG